MRRAIAAIVTALALAIPATAAAQCPKTSLGEIEDEVMCPVCGTPLGLATDAPQAQREREFIQRLVDDCRSEDEIKRALVAQFGDEVLALPGDEGDEGGVGDVLVYVVPALALVGGAIGIALAAGRWRRGGRARASTATPAPDGSARLDADLDRYDL